MAVSVALGTGATAVPVGVGVSVGGKDVTVGVGVSVGVGVGMLRLIVTLRSAYFSSPFESWRRRVTCGSATPSKFHVWIKEGVGKVLVPSAKTFHWSGSGPGPYSSFQPVSPPF